MSKTAQLAKDSHSTRVAFATKKYPTFGRGVYSEANPPSTVTASPFYWWFKFLQLNEEYARAVAGKRTSIERQVVVDLGNVSNVDFKTWWRSHSHLFAEPVSTFKMYVPRSANELVPFNDTEVINLVVPLNWSNVGIKRRFAQIIDTLVPKTPKGARAHKTSEAKYRLGRKWSTVAFKHAYDIYIAKQAADQLLAETGKRTYWADIAVAANLPQAKLLAKETASHRIATLRTQLTIQANRSYKQAIAFIAASATQTFPSPTARRE